MTAASVSPEELGVRAARIKLAVFDVDGVLTDGGLWYGADGEVMKRFDVKDGQGMTMAAQAGLQVAWLTARTSRIVAVRAQELSIARVHQGRKDKGPSLEALCQELGLALEQTAYMGDDVNDLPALALAGLAACPADAVPRVQAAAHFVSPCRGGHGAARSLLELVLDSRKPAGGATIAPWP